MGNGSRCPKKPGLVRSPQGRFHHGHRRHSFQNISVTGSLVTGYLQNVSRQQTREFCYLAVLTEIHCFSRDKNCSPTQTSFSAPKFTAIRHNFPHETFQFSPFSPIRRWTLLVCVENKRSKRRLLRSIGGTELKFDSDSCSERPAGRIVVPKPHPMDLKCARCACCLRARGFARGVDRCGA